MRTKPDPTIGSISKFVIIQIKILGNREATIEDLAFAFLLGGGTASLSPFQRSPLRLAASPSRRQ